VDGISGTYFKDVEIAAKDSLFIFVKVTINPAQVNNPFLVSDSVVFRNKNSQQKVDLIAYGQDAHFVVADRESAYGPIKIAVQEGQTVHWTNDKPWVIFGFATVDSLGTLIIDAGTKIYSHKNGGLLIHKGASLQVNGTAADPVLFKSDVLNYSMSENKSGQWSRIWIMESSQNSVLNHAIVENAEVGIDIESMQQREAGKTIIRNCLIKNSYFYGIQIRNAEVEMENTIIANSEQTNVLSMRVGDLLANHVTIANYKNTKNAAACAFKNYFFDYVVVGNTLQTIQYEGATNIIFNNCIVYGNKEEELLEEAGEQTSSLINYQLNNCLVRSRWNNAHLTQCIFNQDPLFKDISKYEFSLLLNSPAINAGKTGLGITNDYAGNSRDGQPDIGAYEFGGN
jgi:hypothetical protein